MHLSIGQQRLLAPLVWGGLAWMLTRRLRPDQQERRAAVQAGLGLATADYAFEAAVSRLGLWRYTGSFRFLGLPVDMFLDFWILGYTFALTLKPFRRHKAAALTQATWVGVTTAVLGTWARYRNTLAARQGFVRFAEAVAPGTRRFTLGNYGLFGLALSLTAIINGWCLKRSK